MVKRWCLKRITQGHKAPARSVAPPPSVPPKMGGVVAILMLLGVLLPMLGASLILIWLTEHLILPRLPGLARWLGLELDDGGAAPLP
jgi:uncharacterized iron-regulated membrane protein